MKYYIGQVRELVLSQTTKNTSVVFLGNVVSSITAIVFTILAARFLGPEGWGIVAAVGNLIPILVALSDFGLGASMFQYTSGKWGTKEEGKARKAYQTSLSLRLLTASAISFILVVFSSFLSKIAFGFDEPMLAIIVSIGFLGFTLLDFQIFSLEAKQSWRVAAVFISLTNIFRVGLVLLLAWLGLLNLPTVLLVFSGSSFFAFLLSLFFISSMPILHKGWEEFVKNFASFSAWMGGNKIISVLASRLDILLVIQIAGAHEAGIYGAANRLALGVPLILGSFATVLASRFASLENKSQLLSFFKKSIFLSFVIAAGIVLGIIVTPLVISLLGADYARSTGVLQGLFLAMIPFALATPAVNILIYHFKKPSVITYLSIVQLLLIVLVSYYFLPTTIGIFAPVLALGISNVLSLVVTYIFAFKYLSQNV